MKRMRRYTGPLGLFMTGTALASLAPGFPGQAASAQTALRSFHIAAQPLGDSLDAFGRQSGLAVRRDALPVDAAATRAAPVEGTMPTDRALAILLSDTGLSWSEQGGVVRIVRAGGGARAAGSDIALGQVDVAARMTDAGDAYALAGGKPAVLTTTTRKAQLDQLQIDSLADYSRRIDAGVDFNASTSSVNIRGLDENRVVTTVDGIPVPWLYDGARGVQGGVATYDFDGLSKLDVVKDSDSSVFGTGALGGVLAVQTLDPEDVLGKNKSVGGLTKFVYNSADKSWYVNQAVAMRVNRTSVLFQGSYRGGSELDNNASVGGSGTTRTETDPASSVQRNLLGKIYQEFGIGHRIGLTGEYFVRDYDENTLTSVGSTYSRYATDTVNSRKRIAGSYDYAAPDRSGWIDKAHLSVFWQKVGLGIDTQSNRLVAPIGEYDRDSKLAEESYGAIGSVEKAFDTPIGVNHVSAGLDVRGTHTTQYAAGFDNCTAAIYACAYLHTNQSDMPDVDGASVGVFAQDRIDMLSSRLRLTPGLRFDWYDRDPKETATYTANDAYTGLPSSVSDSKVSPKILAEYDIVPKLTLFAQWSQALRAPSATELYLTYGGSGSYLVIGNPALKSETSNGFLGGVNYGDDRLGARLTVYDNYYHNFIDQVTYTTAQAGIAGNYPFGVFKYINRAHVQIWGAELSAHWRFATHWHSWASLVYANGRDTDEDTYLNTIPPMKGIVGIGYAHDGWGSDLSFTGAIRRSDVEDDAAVNKTPGYGVVDLTGWWRPDFAPNLRLQAGLFNLFDQHYYDALDIPDNASLSQSYYAQPGRTFKLSALFRF